ncbi:MAG: hypothetical protein Tsb006_6370 [Rickettsiaceae bacterium]
MVKPIIFGISGTHLTENEIDLFTHDPCVGFILFTRNIENKNQLLELTKSLRELYPQRQIPILVDQEGGRVARVKPPIAKKLYPCAEHFASIYDDNKTLAKQELKANYAELMLELKQFGIDSPCAPVCDLFFENANEVIGDRSFGTSPEKVIDLCKSAISGILHSGGIPFIKHIPGHGRALVDSHFELPVIDAPLAELEATDFLVFKELASQQSWAMTAHIIYSAIDPLLPTTISPKIIQYIRNNIGFKGNLVSDDLGMYALHGEVGKKRGILKKVIKLAENNIVWKEDYAELLEEFLGINTYQIGNPAIIDICNKKLQDSNTDFLESLAKVTKMSLDAGCDMVLHCSGDINEMRAVSSAIAEHKTEINI